MPADLPRLGPTGATRPPVRIVHLGLGAFYRAHVALYVDDANQRSADQWGICGVSLQSPGQRDKLKPQEFVYTALKLTPDGAVPRVVEVVRDVLVAPEDPEAVIIQMADPAVEIVTLTVTEKGYCHVPSTGRLNRDHPGIVHDLATLDRPQTAIGFLVSALARRMCADQAPFTVMSCDNLPENGATVRKVVLEFAGLVDPALAAWIAGNGAFPSSMVDSIVPATTDADIAKVAQLTGKHDASPVMHEPFRQWVIENEFVGKHPDFASAGAQMVEDVRPFELMKLRCLNGTHSSLAYLGYLAAYETIAETVGDPAFVLLLDRLWTDEITPSFQAPPDTDLSAYCASLLERYRNPSIRHRTWQIAMDGSQKLPQRLLGTISDNLAAGRPVDCLALAVAAWMQYVSGTDLAGQPIDVRDPLASQMADAQRGIDNPADRVDAMLAFGNVFPAHLSGNRLLRNKIITSLQLLVRDGVHSAIREVTRS